MASLAGVAFSFFFFFFKPFSPAFQEFNVPKLHFALILVFSVLFQLINSMSMLLLLSACVFTGVI